MHTLSDTKAHMQRGTQTAQDSLLSLTLLPQSSEGNGRGSDTAWTDAHKMHRTCAEERQSRLSVAIATETPAQNPPWQKHMRNTVEQHQ